MPPKTKEPNLLAQGHGFVAGAPFGLPLSFAPLSRVGWQRRGHRLFGNVAILFSKLFCVATLFDFGEKRCRKNLPLCTTSGYRMTLIVDLFAPDSGPYSYLDELDHDAAALRVIPQATLGFAGTGVTRALDFLPQLRRW